jgi:hypothetical protein
MPPFGAIFDSSTNIMGAIRIGCGLLPRECSAYLDIGLLSDCVIAEIMKTDCVDTMLDGLSSLNSVTDTAYITIMRTIKAAGSPCNPKPHPNTSRYQVEGDLIDILPEGLYTSHNPGSQASRSNGSGRST